MARIGNVLITGGSGFLGVHLVKKLLARYPDIKIRTMSRNEGEIQRAVLACSSNRLEAIVADIRDNDALKDALKGVNCLIHLAAMKHIDLCELNPMEASSINVVGTMNLLKLFEGDTFLGMSTDKALEARGCYGATKLLLEKLILGKAKYHKDRRYMVVRSGNIFGSSGSVVERWRYQIRERNEVVATNLEMTRFFIDVHSLADFIIEIVEHGETGKIYIPFQKAIVLGDLAKAVIEMYGSDNTKIRITGLRPGEKEHETLFLPDEDVVTALKEKSSQLVEKMSMAEIRRLLNGSAIAD